MDVSDGLLADLGHICKASGFGAQVRCEDLPLAAGLLSRLGEQQAIRHALTGGDDYELCFTVAPEQVAAVDKLAGELAVALTMVGEIRNEGEVVCLHNGVPVEYADKGYRHF